VAATAALAVKLEVALFLALLRSSVRSIRVATTAALAVGLDLVLLRLDLLLILHALPPFGCLKLALRSLDAPRAGFLPPGLPKAAVRL